MIRAGLVLLALCAASSVASAILPPEAERLERTLRGVTSLEASLSQIRTVYLTGEEVESVGSLAFRPPHAFRLAYETPEPQELVIAGDSLWVVLPEENQAQRYAFTPEAPGSEVFLLFGGKSRSLEDAFLIEQEPWQGNDGALLLRPRRDPEGHPIEEIRLVVGKNGLPRHLFYRETSGDTVDIVFHRFRINPDDIDEAVALRLPEGIEIIDGTPPDLQDGLVEGEEPR